MIDETITPDVDGNGESAESTPAGGVSTVNVNGMIGKGHVTLYETSPAGQITIHKDIRGSHSMSTPEGNTYKFGIGKVEGDVYVFMGP